MAKLLAILFLGGALFEGLAPRPQPPLLIDSPTSASSPALDAAD